MLKRIYIDYSEYSEDWDKTIPDIQNDSSYPDNFIDIKFHKLYRNPPPHKFFYTSFEVSNEKLLNLNRLFLCVIRFSKGTAKTNGAWEIVGIAPTHKIAVLILQEVLNNDNSIENTEIHELEVV